MENLKNGLENLRMVCEESNDSPEKIRKNQEWLSEIAEFCKVYTGDKKSYLDHIKENIEKFLPVLERELEIFEA